MVDGQEGAGEVSENTGVTAASSWSEIGASVVEAAADPAVVDDGQAAEEVAPVVGDEDTPADPAVGEAAGETQDTDAGELESELDKILADVDPETLPEELRPLYEQLLDKKRNLQAGYTKARQSDREVVAEKNAENEELRARIAALEGRSQQPAQTPADAEAALWEGLGDPLVLEEALETHEGLEKYIEQKATVAARRMAVELVNNYIGPQLSSVTGYVDQAFQRQAATEFSAVRESFPELAEHPQGLATAMQLLEAGTAPTLEEAARMADGLLFADQRTEQALTLGMEVGKQRKQAVTEAQKKFTTPSASTGAGPANDKPHAGMSWGDIAASVVRR